MYFTDIVWYLLPSTDVNMLQLQTTVTCCCIKQLLGCLWLVWVKSLALMLLFLVSLVPFVCLAKFQPSRCPSPDSHSSALVIHMTSPSPQDTRIVRLHYSISGCILCSYRVGNWKNITIVRDSLLNMFPCKKLLRHRKIGKHTFLTGKFLCQHCFSLKQINGGEQ